MRLYHQPRSRSTRVLWTLEEVGAPYDLTVIDRETKQTPAYLAMHPLGRSPVMELDGGPVFESVALVLHVADCYPAAGLIAAPGSHDRALQYQWMAFAASELDATLMEIARQLWSDTPDETIVDAATARLTPPVGVVERALAGVDYLVGNAFSVADILVGASLGFARTAELAVLPETIGSYLDHLDARPARQRANAITAADSRS